jgi:hypothetical protein
MIRPLYQVSEIENKYNIAIITYEHMWMLEFMRWVQQEMDFFAEKFRRQVFFDQQPFDVIAECIKCALAECAKVMSSVLNVYVSVLVVMLIDM